MPGQQQTNTVGKAVVENVRVNVAGAVSRRSVVAGLFASAAASPTIAETSIDPHERVRLAADELAASMKALHGGEWSTRISHKHGYAKVSRDLDTL